MCLFAICLSFYRIFVPDHELCLLLKMDIHLNLFGAAWTVTLLFNPLALEMDI